MKFRKLLLSLLFFTAIAGAQTHFTKFTAAKYIQVQIRITHEDSLRICQIDLSKYSGKEKISIELQEIKDSDSSRVLIFHAKKLHQTIYIDTPIWFLLDVALLSDLNGDGRYDIKLNFFGTGNGLAGLAATKLYMYSNGDEFRAFTFLDFSSEKEYDFNNDGQYEILGCNHVYKDEHSYWVYNAYDFIGNKMINISEKIGYPLWTKHLMRTNRVVAGNVSPADRIRELKPLPDNFHYCFKIVD